MPAIGASLVLHPVESIPMPRARCTRPKFEAALVRGIRQGRQGEPMDTKLFDLLARLRARAHLSAPRVNAFIEASLRDAGLLPRAASRPAPAAAEVIEGEFKVVDLTDAGEPAAGATGDAARGEAAPTGYADRRATHILGAAHYACFLSGDHDAVRSDHLPSSARRSRIGPVAGFTSDRFAFNGDQREYKLFVPTGRLDAPRTMIVMLHGCTQDPDDFARGTRMNARAQEAGALVLYPAQAARSNSAKCWNWFQQADQGRDAGEPALLAGMTRHIAARHGVDPRRVHVAGLSAGGAMAAILGRAYPDLYASIGVHSGLPPGAAHDVPSAFAAMRQAPAAPAPMPAVPVIVFHGDRDTTVDPRNGENVLGAAGDRSRSAGECGRRYTRTVVTGPGGQVRAEHWLVHGAGHAWSGGSTDGSYADVLGPDASREMLRFFREHPASGA